MIIELMGRHEVVILMEFSLNVNLDWSPWVRVQFGTRPRWSDSPLTLRPPELCFSSVLLESFSVKVGFEFRVSGRNDRLTFYIRLCRWGITGLSDGSVSQRCYGQRLHCDVVV